MSTDQAKIKRPNPVPTKPSKAKGAAVCKAVKKRRIFKVSTFHH